MPVEAEKLAKLRRLLVASSGERVAAKIPLGPKAVDDVLGGGLSAALHEVYADHAVEAGCASGFALVMALRLAGAKSLFWITTDFAALEQGCVSPAGLLEMGGDPRRFFMLRLAKGEDALKAAADVVGAGACGAVVLEIQGSLKALDLTASRRLSLAAQERGVPIILLRLGTMPDASAAETRWQIGAGSSPRPMGDEDWGQPRFTARLLRHRHGHTGCWQMTWNSDDGIFADIQSPRLSAAAHPVGLVSTLADRSLVAARRSG